MIQKKQKKQYRDKNKLSFKENHSFSLYIHTKINFPTQVYLIVFLFIIICLVLVSFSWQLKMSRACTHTLIV